MSDKISRRDFIKRSAVGIIAGTAAFSVLDLDKLAAKSAYGISHKSGGDKIIKLSENPDLTKVGGSIRVTDDVLLIRTSQTQFTAVRTVCTHKGCDVDLSGDKFVCPCHGSEYTLEGKVTQGPSKANLKTYDTAFDSDKGLVTISGLGGNDNNTNPTDSTKNKK